MNAPIRLLVASSLLATLALPGCDAPQHESVTFGGQDGTCNDCHMQDYDRSAFDHRSVDYGERCAECHTESTWDPIFQPDHAQFFRLLGTHAEQRCQSCHAPDRANPQPTDCLGCHLADRARAEPDHASFPVTCDDCHGNTAWQPANFGEHDAWWLLDGAHEQTACSNCHIDGVYEGTPRECLDCHREERDIAEPDHNGFPVECRECHTTSAWTPASFGDHDAWWPLRGQHARTECGDCHVGGVYEGTPRTCVGCHADDRDRARPDHSDFPQLCTDCHSEEAWRPAAFDHDAYFPIEGAHQENSCQDCHIGDRYAGTPRTCVGCHAEDRDRARPTHARFSDTCTECHTQVAFSPASHRHRTFIVPHEGVRQCLDCHTDPQDYSNVGCTSCHEHSRNNTDGEHRGVDGYRYADAACLECHPDGRE